MDTATTNAVRATPAGHSLNGAFGDLTHPC